MEAASGHAIGHAHEAEGAGVADESGDKSTAADGAEDCGDSGVYVSRGGGTASDRRRRHSGNEQQHNEPPPLTLANAGETSLPALDESDGVFRMDGEESDRSQRAPCDTAAGELDCDQLSSLTITTTSTVSAEHDDVRAITPPAKFGRCSSVRSALKSAGSSSRRKKMVRFADALGLDLVNVRHFIDPADYAPLRRDVGSPFDSVEELRLVTCASHPASPSPRYSYATASTLSAASYSAARHQRFGGKQLVPATPLPTAYNVYGKIHTEHVCLESVEVQDMCIAGIVLVENIAFEKMVHVRYSMDGWRSMADLAAAYIPGTSDGFTDKFLFNLTAPFDLPVGASVEFALRFTARQGAEEHWDNNRGRNYVFDCTLEDLPPPPQHCVPLSSSVPVGHMAAQHGAAGGNASAAAAVHRRQARVFGGRLLADRSWVHLF